MMRMLKRSVLIFLLSVFYKTASSQVLIALLFGDELNTGKIEFGLTVSPTFTNLTNITSKYRPGIDFGLYFNFKASDRFYLHPEAIPKMVFGAKHIAPYGTGNANLDSLYVNGSVNRKIGAIGLPLLVRYRVAGLFFVEGGPQVNLLTQSKDIFENEVDDNELTYEIKTKDNYTRFEVGYAAGLAYKIKPGLRGMTVGFRYYGGLTDIMKTEEGSQKNSKWLLNVYIPVGAGKAEKKREAGNRQ